MQPIIESMAASTGFRRTPAAELAPLNLAYLGDTVYDLYIRSCLVHTHPVTVNELHRLSSARVCAAAQAAAYHKIEPLLTGEEADIFRRGRNAHSGTVPKNASVSDYRIATGLETLLGWLFSRGMDERLNTLMKIILSEKTDEQQEG